MNEPLVSVKTITYNHEPYIGKCIEGVLSQKTNFNFEFIIGEDCSTDNTLMIINEYVNKYPERIKLITSEKNVGAAANDKRTDEACRGKYVAFCEGDDYWTDPYKLQKQVDFLEANPEFGLVHTNFSCVKGDKFLRGFRDGEKLPTGNILSDLIKGNHIATASVCMRNELLQSIRIDEPIRKFNWSMGDYPLWIEAAARVKVHYLADDTITYRIHNTSATHGLDTKGDFKFFSDRYDIKRHYIKKFGCEDLEPFIDKMFHRELLKFAIFFKDEELRKKCYNYFKQSALSENFLYLFLSQYNIFDFMFCLVYNTRKKLTMVV